MRILVDRKYGTQLGERTLWQSLFALESNVLNFSFNLEINFISKIYF